MASSSVFLYSGRSKNIELWFTLNEDISMISHVAQQLTLLVNTVDLLDFGIGARRQDLNQAGFVSSGSLSGKQKHESGALLTVASPVKQTSF